MGVVLVDGLACQEGRSGAGKMRAGRGAAGSSCPGEWPLSPGPGNPPRHAQARCGSVSQSLSCVWLSVAPPGSSVHGILQARILAKSNRGVGVE